MSTRSEGSQFKIFRAKAFMIPNLEAEELEELLNRAKCGDNEAKNRIILAHMKHVFTYVEKHYEFKNRQEYEECISHAYFSLYSAIDGYKFDKGASFSSYSDNWIRKVVLKFFDSLKPKISNVQDVNKLQKAEDEYYRKFGELPSIEQLSEMLDKPTEKVQKLRDEKIKRERNYDKEVNDKAYDLLNADRASWDNPDKISDDNDIDNIITKVDANQIRKRLEKDKRINNGDLVIFDLMMQEGFEEAENFTVVRGAKELNITHQAVSARVAKIRKILIELGFKDDLSFY